MKSNLTLQELIEYGYIQKIECNDTHLGRGFDVTVDLKCSSIYHVSICVGIDESLNETVVLINSMIDTIESFEDRNKLKEPITKREEEEE